MNTELIGGSLFTGYGGLDMAAAGALGPINFAWHSDTKPSAVTLLEHRYPEVPNLGDITQIDFTDVTPVDVITAGWPCQPWSTAGRRLGEADPRALWPDVHRAIATLRPRLFLGENVPRITTSGELRRVARSLAEIGYVGSWRCNSASDIGAPHRRIRCFVLAYDADRGVPTDLFDDTLAPPPVSPTRGLTLLPTPSHRDGRRGAGWGDRPGRPLSETIHRIADPTGGWREYAAAIARWEYIIDCPAPPPVLPGRLGSPTLAHPFVEWMMGVPLGHLSTVPGLSRGQCVSMLGDGVVPLQAAAAYAQLLADLRSAALEDVS